MPRNLVFTDGQVAASATAIVSSTADQGENLTLTFYNTGSSQTLTITYSRNGGTVRNLFRFVLSQYESVQISGVPVNSGDVIYAATTDASTVDYTVSGAPIGTHHPLSVTVFDANGAIKSGSAALSGAITLAGLLTLTTGFVKDAVARTATSDGTGTGTIADAGMLQFVTVTSSNANNIITLPTPTPGTIVVLRNGGTGYELRTSTPASIAINGGSGAGAESAIAANTLVIAICGTATAWHAFSIVGTTLANVEAAAA